MAANVVDDGAVDAAGVGGVRDAGGVRELVQSVIKEIPYYKRPFNT